MGLHPSLGGSLCHSLRMVGSGCVPVDVMVNGGSCVTCMGAH